MHQTFPFLALLVAIGLIAVAEAATPSTKPTSKPVWQKNANGELILRPFDHAPYPHASRKDGFKGSSKSWPRDPNYVDSTCGVFIPADYKPGNTVDYVVHFHGHNNHVSQVVEEYKLMSQLNDSKVNAILIVPQGPKDAADSGGGKLELDKDAFAKLIAEVTTFLNDEHKIHTTKVGKIALTTHSGGYKVTAGILHLGGMNDHITDVILLDSSYGSLEYYVDWAKGDPSRRLVSLFTDHLADTNKEFMDDMTKADVKFQKLDETTVTDAEFAHRGVTYMHTKGPHDQVPVDYFGRLLKTSALAKD